MLNKIKKFILLKILKKKYYRVGKCNCCGKCCQNIYVNHGKKGFIKTEKEFNRLKFLHSFYRGLEIVGKDDFGLLFKCRRFNPVTKKCTVHFFRPLICRKYPMEEIFKMGGILAPECGYRLVPIESFNNVLSKLSK